MFKIRKTLFLIATAMIGCSSLPPKAIVPPSVTHRGVIGNVPFKLHDNRILVQVMLNGRGPYTMIFDTGGANTITPQVQRQLGLASQGEETGEGAGANTFSVQSVHMRTLNLGSVTLSEQNFMVIDLSKIRKAFGFARLDGVIGLEILQRGRVRIDFDNQRLSVLEPGSQDRMPGATVHGFTVVNGKPVMDGAINGHSAKILIDTGDRSNLTLFQGYARSSKLEALFARREKVMTGMGLGGPIPGKIAAVDSVILGGQEITDVLARLPLTAGGFFASSNLSASVGIGLLKSFNLEFDYQKSELAMQSRAGYNEPSSFVPLRR